MPTPAERFRERRFDLGLSKPEIAEKLGVNLRAVERWEEGSRKPSVIVFKLLDTLTPTGHPPREQIRSKSDSPLARRRREFGLTQEQLARKIGVKRLTISNWEQEVSVPDPENSAKLRDILYGSKRVSMRSEI